jgi:hypothetical protein
MSRRAGSARPPALRTTTNFDRLVTKFKKSATKLMGESEM